MGIVLNNLHPFLSPQRSVGRLALATACALAGAPAWALTDFHPYATVATEYESNVFDRSAGQPPYADTGNTKLGDTVFKYLGGADLDIAWERDRLRLNAQGERFEYDRFGQLDHTEYKFGGDFDWHLGPVLDGSLVYNQNHIMSPPADTLSDVLELQTERTATSTFRVLVTPRWRFDLAPTWHELETPLQEYPDFGLKEGGAAASLNYLGINKLTAGLRIEYTDGAFHDIIAATSYHQTTAQLTADYAVSGFSAFDGRIGYTERTNSLVDAGQAIAQGVDIAGIEGKTNSFTGELGFRRQLSVKTSVYLSIFRRVESYVAGANTDIGTGGDVGATWNPDVKFTVSLHYRQETQSIQGVQFITGFANRVDHLHSAELFVKYHIRDWLTLRPYVSHDDRGSNYPDISYLATIVGIDLTARWQ